MKKEKPTHKKCRQCGEWFMLRPRAHRWQKFCSNGCAATYRTAQPKWKQEQSRKAKAQADPVVMSARAKAMWLDPEMRAHLTEKNRIKSNSKKHLAWMTEHNKKLWEDERFRKAHSERTRKQTAERWTDPAYREKMSAITTEQNKLRWADPEYKERVSRNIRIAKAGTLAKKRQIKNAQEISQRPEVRARRSREMKERWDDPEQRASMSKQASERAIKKWRDDPAYRKKNLAGLVAHAKSEANRTRMSELNKKLWADPEYVAKRKAEWTPERKAAQAEENRKRWSDPDYKARVAKKISMAKRRAQDDATH